MTDNMALRILIFPPGTTLYIYYLPVYLQNARGGPAFEISFIVMAKQQLM